MKRNFNISIKRSANYQSVEASMGFEGEMTEQDYLNNCNITVQAVKEKVEHELSLLGKEQVKLNL